MRLLDLYCCQGGAAMGYYRAGFTEIVGVDIKPQPRYPFTFIQGNAIQYAIEHGYEFDAIHASPPCQVHSVLAHLSRPTHQDWIPATRETLIKIGLPHVIENVPGATLHAPVLLCGSMFGLSTTCGAQLRRHRLFEVNFPIGLTYPCNHIGRTIGIFGDKARDTAREKQHYSKPKETRGLPSRIGFTLEDARIAMGIDWMDFKGLAQAIPPAYTEFLGRQLIAALTGVHSGLRPFEGTQTAPNSSPA